MSYLTNALLISLFVCPLAAVAQGDGAEAAVVSENRIATEAPEPQKIREKIMVLRLTEPYSLNNRELKVDVLFRLGKRFGLGPSLAVMRNRDDATIGSRGYSLGNYDIESDREQIGIKGAYYFRGFNARSAYLNAFARQASTSMDSIYRRTGAKASTSFDHKVYGFTAGYQWVVGLLRLSIGGGFERHDAPENVQLRYDDGTAFDFGTFGGQGVNIIVDGGIGVTF